MVKNTNKAYSWYIIQTPFQIFSKHTKEEYTSLAVLVEFLALAYWLLFLPVISSSSNLLFVKAVRNEALDLKDIIIGFKNYLNIILAHLLATALIGISFVALIIPGIIVGCRLAFVSYLVMDKGLDPIEAVETSWKMTKDLAWRIFFLYLASILIFILGLCLLIVGIFPAIMWVQSSFASLYEAVLNDRKDLFPPLIISETE
ncbi:MAG TPA: hypothetical protein DIT07_07895 [Sphingobacteriaceae bacterium]|nr:hypothetical protein [Sphingobacteriaceae bacterium]